MKLSYFIHINIIFYWFIEKSEPPFYKLHMNMYIHVQYACFGNYACSSNGHIIRMSLFSLLSHTFVYNHCMLHFVKFIRKEPDRKIVAQFCQKQPLFVTINICQNGGKLFF